MHKRTNHTVNASDIARRFTAIAAAGVTEVDYFIFDSNRAMWPQGPHAPLLPVAQVPMWWGAIRNGIAMGVTPQNFLQMGWASGASEVCLQSQNDDSLHINCIPTLICVTPQPLLYSEPPMLA